MPDYYKKYQKYKDKYNNLKENLVGGTVNAHWDKITKKWVISNNRDDRDAKEFYNLQAKYVITCKTFYNNTLNKRFREAGDQAMFNFDVFLRNYVITRSNNLISDQFYTDIIEEFIDAYKYLRMKYKLEAQTIIDDLESILEPLIELIKDKVDFNKKQGKGAGNQMKTHLRFINEFLIHSRNQLLDYINILRDNVPIREAEKKKAEPDTKSTLAHHFGSDEESSGSSSSSGMKDKTFTPQEFEQAQLEMKEREKVEKRERNEKEKVLEQRRLHQHLQMQATAAADADASVVDDDGFQTFVTKRKRKDRK